FKTRIGHKRAIVAAAHLLALTIYQVLDTKEPYYRHSAQFKPRDIQRLRQHHSRRLKTLDRWLKDQNCQS
ncbi:MAG: hypothetical protein M3Z09_02580, partial [Acidobacteriota bacterium]|nr:hypothetical protein [Acidobacteriota bacterium]